MSPSDVFADYEKRGEFFELASRIFATSRAELNDESAYGSIAGWDSVNHLRLVMEAERRFGMRYPLERIASLRTLADFFV